MLTCQRMTVMSFEQTWIRVHETDKHIGIEDGDVKVTVSY